MVTTLESTDLFRFKGGYLLYSETENPGKDDLVDIRKLQENIKNSKLSPDTKITLYTYFGGDLFLVSTYNVGQLSDDNILRKILDPQNRVGIRSSAEYGLRISQILKSAISKMPERKDDYLQKYNGKTA